MKNKIIGADIYMMLNVLMMKVAIRVNVFLPWVVMKIVSTRWMMTMII